MSNMNCQKFLHDGKRSIIVGANGRSPPQQIDLLVQKSYGFNEL